MCKFFSVVTMGDGKPLFFSLEMRRELSKSNPKGYNFDSHASICDHFGVNEDKSNKWEIDPITMEVRDDELYAPVNDRKKVEKWIKEFDFASLWESGLFGLDLSGLTSIPEGFKFPDTIGGYLDLESLTSIPQGFKFPDTIGGYLYLRSLTSIPQGFKFPDTIGGSLYLSGLTSIPEGLIQKFGRKIIR